MKLLCKVFDHKWRHCRCARCGQGRDEEHDWNGCVCAVCGGKRDERHDWDEACRCRKCGIVGHVWDGCTCSRCGVVSADNSRHDWHGCRCRKCGLERDYPHIWRPGKDDKHLVACSVCGQTRTAHKWTPIPTGKEPCLHQCSICGDKGLIHRGKCTCKVCGRGIPVHYAHDWEYWSEGLYGGTTGQKCRRCGTICRHIDRFAEIGDDFETYRWSVVEGNSRFGREEYILRADCHDKNSPDGRGYRLLNLANRSERLVIATKLRK